MNTMEQMSPTSTRRPFKLFEHPLTQFNDVVIPHRLDMMRKHKCNIEKVSIFIEFVFLFLFFCGLCYELVAIFQTNLTDNHETC